MYTSLWQNQPITDPFGRFTNHYFRCAPGFEGPYCEEVYHVNRHDGPARPYFSELTHAVSTSKIFMGNNG